jgi:alpha-galactosidase
MPRRSLAAALAQVLLLSARQPAAQPTNEPGFAPGWNGLAKKPAMGWRSWNAFQYCIRAGLPGDNSSCAMAGPASKPFLPMSCESSTGRPCGSIAAMIDRITKRNVTLGGKLVSLAELGYDSVGIDEGWEGCGEGVNGTQHDAQGNPLANKRRFPDLAGLVEFGRQRHIKMGWYLNGCGCPEILTQFGGKITPAQLERIYEGDVRTLSALNFSGVKLDGCGSLRNNTRYAALMQATGKAFDVENCHW